MATGSCKNSTLYTMPVLEDTSVISDNSTALSISALSNMSSNTNVTAFGASKLHCPLCTPARQKKLSFSSSKALENHLDDFHNTSTSLAKRSSRESRTNMVFSPSQVEIANLENQIQAVIKLEFDQLSDVVPSKVSVKSNPMPLKLRYSPQLTVTSVETSRSLRQKEGEIVWLKENQRQLLNEIRTISDDLSRSKIQESQMESDLRRLARWIRQTENLNRSYATHLKQALRQYFISEHQHTFHPTKQSLHRPSITTSSHTQYDAKYDAKGSERAGQRKVRAVVEESGARFRKPKKWEIEKVQPDLDLNSQVLI